MSKLDELLAKVGHPPTPPKGGAMVFWICSAGHSFRAPSLPWPGLREPPERRCMCGHKAKPASKTKARDKRDDAARASGIILSDL